METDELDEADELDSFAGFEETNRTSTEPSPTFSRIIPIRTFHASLNFVLSSALRSENFMYSFLAFMARLMVLKTSHESR
jgi:hypothetical protein